MSHDELSSALTSTLPQGTHLINIRQTMYHALEIQEILSNILGHCHDFDEPRAFVRAMASLARTCRTFKEPALDALWKRLYDLSPLARCLPEASHRLSTHEYSLSRPLMQAEYDILRGYTRRIRSMTDLQGGLDKKSLRILSNHPTTEPLFPNLRSLSLTQAMHLLHLPFPSLTSINFYFHNPYWPRNSLESFAKLSPNIRDISVKVGQPDAAISKTVSNCICQWQNLQTVICPHLALDINSLIHLSRVPALTRLEFAPGSMLPSSNSPLLFSNLCDLVVYSESLETMSWLLSQSRLPAIINFIVTVDRCPSRQELASFLNSILSSGASHTMESLRLFQSLSLPSNTFDLDALVLGLEDLRPCMAFGNLDTLQFNIEWNVELKDDELLTLASSWPHLERLIINEDFGWNTQDGITPNGLLQLLQTCPSLHFISLSIDTHGYTELPTSGLLANLTLPRETLYLDVLDSIIEVESIPALVAFFADTPCSYICFEYWGGRKMGRPSRWEVYCDRWNDVREQARGLGVVKRPLCPVRTPMRARRSRSL